MLYVTWVAVKSSSLALGPTVTLSVAGASVYSALLAVSV